MVKQPTTAEITRKMKSDVTRLRKDGQPRRKPGPTADAAKMKDDRVVLRAHADLAQFVTTGASERGITKSQFVEKLLVGFNNLDPRQPRLNMNGRRSETSMGPIERMEKQPMEFEAQWKRFVELSGLLTGFTPPREWFEDFGRFADGPDPEDVE
jgi:hypothetical protein